MRIEFESLHDLVEFMGTFQVKRSRTPKLSALETNAKFLAHKWMPADKKIQAVKELRDFHGLGLKEAKDLIEKYWIPQHRY